MWSHERRSPNVGSNKTHFLVFLFAPGGGIWHGSFKMGSVEHLITKRLAASTVRRMV